jgi:hypothetical protein
MTLSSAPEPVREQVRAMLEGWAAALARSLQHAGVAHARTEAEDRIAAVQGALILARAGGGRGAFARAVERLAAA